MLRSHPSGNSPATEPLDKEHVNNDMSNDKIERASTNRRNFIRGAAALGAGATLAPYLGRAGIVGATTVPAGGDATNPFGIADSSTVDAVIFDGGYGVDYVQFAADIFEQVHEGSTVEVSPSTQIATELQPRFVGGNPPDLVDNSGAQAIGFQHDPRPARGPHRRHRRPQPRGHDDP